MYFHGQTFPKHDKMIYFYRTQTVYSYLTNGSSRAYGRRTRSLTLLIFLVSALSVATTDVARAQAGILVHASADKINSLKMGTAQARGLAPTRSSAPPTPPSCKHTRQHIRKVCGSTMYLLAQTVTSKMWPQTLLERRILMDSLTTRLSNRLLRTVRTVRTQHRSTTQSFWGMATSGRSSQSVPIVPET